MDRNIGASYGRTAKIVSLSARRAWIEMENLFCRALKKKVALRKESVDRNTKKTCLWLKGLPSLSARRAWIEIWAWGPHGTGAEVALRKESVDRNHMA